MAEYVRGQFLENDPADGREVWRVEAGRGGGLCARDAIHMVVFLVPMTLTATMGTISFSASDGSAICSFWPAAALQVVFSIWFGVLGALSGIIGPMLGNSLVGGSPLLFVSANALQSILPGLAFRWLKLDPRLRSRRDWAGLILICCVLSNALGAALGVGEDQLRAVMSGEIRQAGPWWVSYGRWLIGNLAPCLVLTPALLKTASPIIIRGSHFFRRFWGRGRSGHVRHVMHLHDMSMVVKLILLAMAVGVLPLSILAGVAVWDAIVKADKIASIANRAMVRRT